MTMTVKEMIEKLLDIIDSIEERGISLTKEEVDTLIAVEDEFYYVVDYLEKEAE